MPPKPVYIVSDTHLGAVSREREREFVRWLGHAGEAASEVIVNGDLFDFWFEYKSVVPRGHTRVLGALAALVDAGVPVRFVGGNHDWWGGTFLEDEIGLRVHRDPITLDLAGRRTFIGHGDGLGSGDLGYRMLKILLRGRLTRWGFRWIHPDVGAWIAGHASVTKELEGKTTESQLRRSAHLEAWAREKLLNERDLDVVVLGHTHLPKLIEVEPQRFYVNAGDWVNHKTFAVLSHGEPPRLEEWAGG
jgi:UDP-2,3-diacylglucosamine hydrolase